MKLSKFELDFICGSLEIKTLIVSAMLLLFCFCFSFQIAWWNVGCYIKMFVSYCQVHESRMSTKKHKSWHHSGQFHHKANIFDSHSFHWMIYREKNRKVSPSRRLLEETKTNTLSDSINDGDGGRKYSTRLFRSQNFTYRNECANTLNPGTDQSREKLINKEESVVACIQTIMNRDPRGLSSLLSSVRHKIIIKLTQQGWQDRRQTAVRLAYTYLYRHLVDRLWRRRASALLFSLQLPTFTVAHQSLSVNLESKPVK